MTFLQPAGLWLLGLIPVVVLLHLFRSNPRRQRVPSVFLWRDLNRDLTTSRRWRPPPLSLLLVLQILAIAAVALAVASPRITAPPPRHLLVLLDASASMLATDVAPSRFDDALRQGRELLAGLQGQDRATVIRVGPSPTVLAAEAEPAAAQAALDGARAGAGSSAMRQALFLASHLASRTSDSMPEAVVLSDGAFADPGELSGLAMPLRFQSVGHAAERNVDNQAITALNVARQPQPSGALAAFARIVNYADRPTRVPVRLLVDGLQHETRDVQLPARQHSELSFDVPPGSRRVAVGLGAQDILSADDQVEILVEAGHAREVVLVSRVPELLERALRAIPDLRVRTISPETYAEQAGNVGAGADLLVLDGVLPDRLPGGRLLIVNPPSGREYLTVRGESRSTTVSDFDSRHPLLQSVDLSAARLGRVPLLEAPPWARVVAQTTSGPLVLEGQESGRSVVIFAFDPAGSALDKMLAFPLLVSNAVAFLGSGELAPSLPPGRSAILPVAAGVREVQLESPDGSVRQLKLQGESAEIERPETPGRYAIRERGASAGQVRFFSINVASESESELTPRQWPPVQPGPREAERQSVTPLTLWPWLLGLGLIILSVEWWRFGRRG